MTHGRITQDPMTPYEHRAAILVLGMMAALMNGTGNYNVGKRLRASQQEAELDFYKRFKDDKYFIEE